MESFIRRPTNNQSVVDFKLFTFFLYIIIYIVLISSLLSERAGDEGKRQFLQEIDLMKQIGSHRNVLSMLGYWIKSEPIMLIMEYVPHGDLLQWLRNKRQQVSICLYTMLTNMLDSSASKLTFLDIMLYRI